MNDEVMAYSVDEGVGHDEVVEREDALLVGGVLLGGPLVVQVRQILARLDVPIQVVGVCTHIHTYTHTHHSFIHSFSYKVKRNEEGRR